MAERNAYPFLPVPSLSLPEFLLREAAALGNKPALIDGVTGRRVTYGELADAAARTAAGLAARGFGKGDVLAIWSPNLPEYAVAAYGASLAGGIVTTINPLYNAIELAHQLRDSGARALVAGPQFAATAAGASRTASVRDVFVFGEAGGAEPFASLSESGRKLEPVA